MKMLNNGVFVSFASFVEAILEIFAVPFFIGENHNCSFSVLIFFQAFKKLLINSSENLKKFTIWTFFITIKRISIFNKFEHGDKHPSPIFKIALKIISHRFRVKILISLIKSERHTSQVKRSNPVHQIFFSKPKIFCDLI